MSCPLPSTPVRGDKMLTSKSIVPLLQSDNRKVREYTQYLLHKQNAEAGKEFFSQFNIDWSAADVFEKRYYDMPNIIREFDRQWASLVDSVDDIQTARKEMQEPVEEMGLQSIITKARRANKWGNNGEYWLSQLDKDIRPNLSWMMNSGVQDGKQYMRLTAEVMVDRDTGKITTTSPYELKTVSLDIPLMWHKHLELIGQAVIDNKIVLSVRPLGMFGDVEGFAAKIAVKGLKAYDWRTEDVYIGKFTDTVQICKSRMHIKSVAMRKASAEFTDELLASFD